MPIFDYECECGHIQEVMTLSASESPLLKCDECNSDKMTRHLGRFGFKLLGEAWANSGYQYEYTKCKANQEARQYPVYGRKGVQEKLKSMKKLIKEE